MILIMCEYFYQCQWFILNPTKGKSQSITIYFETVVHHIYHYAYLDKYVYSLVLQGPSII